MACQWNIHTAKISTYTVSWNVLINFLVHTIPKILLSNGLLIQSEIYLYINENRVVLTVPYVCIGLAICAYNPTNYCKYIIHCGIEYQNCYILTVYMYSCITWYVHTCPQVLRALEHCAYISGNAFIHAL